MHYRPRYGSFGLALLCLMTLDGCARTSTVARHDALLPVAAGFLARELDDGEKAPSDDEGRAVTPKVTSDFAQFPATNDWWSSLIWRFRTKDGSPYSEDLHPHPFTLRARAEGLEVGYPAVPVVQRDGFDFPHQADLLVAVQGMSSADTKVASYSDWTVTAEWRDPEHSARMTFGHGLPFVYVTDVVGDARVGWFTDQARAPVTLVQQGNVLAVTINEHHYALFAPAGATWATDKTGATAELAGKGYFAVAVLPDGEPATLSLFTRHASAFVTGTKVSYRFDAAQGKLVAAFSLETRRMGDKAGSPGEPLIALYPHQWRASAVQTTGKSYRSSRGEMKLAAASRFEVAYGLGSLLPALPHVAAEENGKLVGMLRMAANAELFPPGLEGKRDSYWDGKNLGRNAELAQLAHQLGKTRMRDRLIDALKQELEDWFDGQSPRYFYYDDTWHTVIGIPSVYYSGSMLNDHHFHYAYYIFAAATIAQFDPAWAERWAPFVETLMKDAGNWDRADTRFPFMRCFDAYAGHSWAAGTPFGPRGNNEESSSEDVNFAAAVAYWGEVMGNDAARDAGLFMYASLVQAIEQYWFDVDGAVFPAGYEHPSVGILWGSGAQYDTWFSNLPGFIHGIQFTPMSVGSVWLGRRPDNLVKNLDHMRKVNEGDVHVWRDLFSMVDALANPRDAFKDLEREHYYEPEVGNSMAHTYAWVSSLSSLGRLVPDVTADAPMYAVFEQSGRRTHAAFNGASTAKRVRFSDGAVLVVPPRSLAHDHR